MAKQYRERATFITDGDARFFYDQQYFVGAAKDWTKEQWKASAEYWRWVAIGHTVGCLDTAEIMPLLRKEVECATSCDEVHSHRLKTWVWEEIKASLERIRLGIDAPQYRMDNAQ